MTVLPVFRMGSEILKRRAAEVPDATAVNVRALVDNMLETMVAQRGIGLAAPQVGEPLRVVIFFVPAQRNEGEEIQLTVMVNPVIEPTGPDQAEDWEGCLSVPGLVGRVPRWTSIRYSFTDLEGRRHVRDAEGYHARVVQHECDHLDGVLYPMRMTDMASLSFTDALEPDAGEEELESDEEGVPAV